MFWVISVYFSIRNTLPKSGIFLLGHPVFKLNVLMCKSRQASTLRRAIPPLSSGNKVEVCVCKMLTNLKPQKPCKPRILHYLKYTLHYPLRFHGCVIIKKAYTLFGWNSDPRAVVKKSVVTMKKLRMMRWAKRVSMREMRDAYKVFLENLKEDIM